jgi:flagellar motor switch protein FliN
MTTRSEVSSQDSETIPPPDVAAEVNGRPSEVLLDLELPFTVTLGSIELTLGEIQQLEAGSVVPLGRGAEGPVQLVVGGRVIARGELVVIDDCFGIRIASVEPHERRLSSLGRV